MNHAIGFETWIDAASYDSAHAMELQMQAVSTGTLPELLPGLVQAIDAAGGWVLQRQMVSPSMLRLRVEAQGRALLDLYASLLEQGLELSREGHLLLTERCTCAQLHREARSQIVTIRLDVTAPDEPGYGADWWNPASA